MDPQAEGYEATGRALFDALAPRDDKDDWGMSGVALHLLAKVGEHLDGSVPQLERWGVATYLRELAEEIEQTPTCADDILPPLAPQPDITPAVEETFGP